MRKLSPATAIACVALFFSLAGTGLAASKYLISSTSQIKPSVLKSLKGKQGSRGPAGAQGSTGPAGAAGAAGTFSASNLTVVDSAPTTVLSDQSGPAAIATCPAGDTVVSGGWAGPLTQTNINYDQPDGTNAWEVIVANTGPTGETVTAVAVCAS